MRAFLPFTVFLLLTGCQTIHFYTQGVRGQIEILAKSQPNAKLIASPDTSSSLKERLILAEELCSFATRELALPGNSAYHKYADLERNHVVFVLHAAPEFSMEPKTWFYPFVGNQAYRGYFNEQDAETYASTLREKGYEVYLGGTDAYSTLGVFHDPLLNTFIDYPELHFTETIFHELTHIRYFVKGDTTFNESLANVVAEEGMRRWLTSKGRHADLASYEELLQRRRDFYQQIAITRSELTKLYASEISEESMHTQKQQILNQLKSRARELQKRWGGKQLTEWLKLDLTNAHILALSVYNQEMPTFQKLLEESGGDFGTFFQKVEAMKP
ncbi:MAG: aminopeptidase [Verrucomicrobiota bacterium]